MRSLIMGLVALLCILVESTILPDIALRGILPNLSLILVVSYAIQRGSREGRCLGLFIGLVQDILFFTTVGFYGLLYYLMGQLCGFIGRHMDRDNYAISLSMILGADLCYGFINYVFLYLLQGDIRIGYYFLRIAVPELCYTGLLALPVYALLRLLNRGIDALTLRLNRRKFGKEG